MVCYESKKKKPIDLRFQFCSSIVLWLGTVLAIAKAGNKIKSSLVMIIKGSQWDSSIEYHNK